MAWTDQEWHDFQSRRIGTIMGEYGRMIDRLGRPRPIAPAGTGRAGPSGPGVLDGVAETVSSLAGWYVEHLLPLAWLAAAGGRLAQAGWRVRAPLAVAGAGLLPPLVLPSVPDAPWPWIGNVLVAILGDWALHAAVALGALAGWLAMSALGAALFATAMIAGLGLALGTLAAALVLVYEVIALLAGWPSFVAYLIS